MQRKILAGRDGYSMSRGSVTRADSGKTQPNWSNILGKFTGADCRTCTTRLKTAESL